MAKVEIYTQWGCPYCTRAKAKLTAKGVKFIDGLEVALKGGQMGDANYFIKARDGVALNPGANT